jgi:phage repressor protein C with HTH and peptisase S24 domain
MTKYDILKKALEEKGRGEMKAFGNSMLPLIESGSLLTFERRETYETGDIVLSRVRGRWIDAHKIVAADANRGFLIANNHGHQNGWTHQVFGKVVRAHFPSGNVRNFS